MLRRILWVVAGLVTVAAIAIGIVLGGAHRDVRRETAALPQPDAIAAVAGVAELVDDPPTRLSVVNTASQAMPRAAVLDPERDPRPDEPYLMSHPAFVVEWADGRMLLIDAGMTRDGARSFGAPLEWLGGAEAMRPHRSAGEALGAAAGRVQAVVFTHLHTDHVGGIGELCARANRLRVPMTEAQAERTNYTTRPGLALLEDADCVQIERVSGGPLFPIAGFPGVFIVDAGGHTPGSQIVLVFARGADGTARHYAFTGDIVNHVDGITYDVPKPFLYRLLIVPESEERQRELRAFLKRLRDDAGFTLLVSHDQHAIEASGVPEWDAR